MKDGLIRVAVATPTIQVANPQHNAKEIVRSAWAATTSGAKVLVTPELAVSGYTCGDLFLRGTLLDGCLSALEAICTETEELDLVLIVGLPLKHKGKLYNCAAVVNAGRVLGVVPKTKLPNYGEFYEQRQFTPAFPGVQLVQEGFLQGTPIGTELLFRCEEMPALQLAVEICEDLWVAAPPSCGHAAAGATVIANLSASDETIGKAEYRRTLVESQSAKLVCAYLYADAGAGESSTDLVFSGHNIIAENGVTLAENQPFEGKLVSCDIDLQRLEFDRRRMNTFFSNSEHEYMILSFSLERSPTEIARAISPTPFVPGESGVLAKRCETILSIQAMGLQKRVEHTGAAKLVIGVSGGLDSTLALLVAARTNVALGRDAKDIIAVTMPCFGTTQRTRTNAEKLCEALGVTFMNIDITETVRAHFDSVGHDESQLDVVFENAQARVRTMTLMNIANGANGLVVGTGDMSELALGWATYNGDHMSMYGVNASVPKTLIQYLIRYYALQQPGLKAVLEDILDTPVSPELLPPQDGDISQKTEELVGPYLLHDFFLYYMLRWGFSPRKIYRLAQKAFAGQFDDATILQWLEVFTRRFFSQQFKRSCLPDGPKVGSVSLSPRGDWRMPSDASPALWLEEIETLKTSGNTVDEAGE